MAGFSDIFSAIASAIAEGNGSSTQTRDAYNKKRTESRKADYSRANVGSGNFAINQLRSPTDATPYSNEWSNGEEPLTIDYKKIVDDKKESEKSSVSDEDFEASEEAADAWKPLRLQREYAAAPGFYDLYDEYAAETGDDMWGDLYGLQWAPESKLKQQSMMDLQRYGFDKYGYNADFDWANHGDDFDYWYDKYYVPNLMDMNDLMTSGTGMRGAIAANTNDVAQLNQHLVDDGWYFANENGENIVQDDPATEENEALDALNDIIIMSYIADASNNGAGLTATQYNELANIIGEQYGWDKNMFGEAGTKSGRDIPYVNVDFSDDPELQAVQASMLDWNPTNTDLYVNNPYGITDEELLRYMLNNYAVIQPTELGMAIPNDYRLNYNPGYRNFLNQRRKEAEKNAESEEKEE